VKVAGKDIETHVLRFQDGWSAVAVLSDGRQVQSFRSDTREQAEHDLYGKLLPIIAPMPQYSEALSGEYEQRVIARADTFTPFKRAMFDLDVALTDRAFQAASQYHHYPDSVEKWYEQPGGNPIWYLSDSGYSRVVYSEETGKLFLTSNSRDQVKARWEAALPERERAEAIIQDSVRKTLGEAFNTEDEDDGNAFSGQGWMDTDDLKAAASKEAQDWADMVLKGHEKAGGIAASKFKPRGTTSKEQSIKSLMREFHRISAKLIEPLRRAAPDLDFEADNSNMDDLPKPGQVASQAVGGIWFMPAMLRGGAQDGAVFPSDTLARIAMRYGVVPGSMMPEISPNATLRDRLVSFTEPSHLADAMAEKFKPEFKAAVNHDLDLDISLYLIDDDYMVSVFIPLDEQAARKAAEANRVVKAFVAAVAQAAPDWPVSIKRVGGLGESATKFAAVVLLKDKDDPKALVVKRDDEPEAGKWACPGGHCDDGECDEDAAARELKEETRLSAKSLTFLCKTADGTAMYCGWANDRSKGTATDDADGLKWVGVNDLPDLAFGNAKHIKQALRKLTMKDEATALARVILDGDSPHALLKSGFDAPYVEVAPASVDSFQLRLLKSEYDGKTLFGWDTGHARLTPEQREFLTVFWESVFDGVNSGEATGKILGEDDVPVGDYSVVGDLSLAQSTDEFYHLNPATVQEARESPRDLLNRHFSSPYALKHEITDSQRLSSVKTQYGHDVRTYDDGFGPLWVLRDSMGIRGVIRAQSWEDAYGIAEDEMFPEADETIEELKQEYGFKRDHVKIVRDQQGNERAATIDDYPLGEKGLEFVRWDTIETPDPEGWTDNEIFQEAYGFRPNGPNERDTIKHGIYQKDLNGESLDRLTVQEAKRLELTIFVEDEE
jgi:8-oxo-dGTP pyrophosphatase MutT (NUDIX family)